MPSSCVLRDNDDNLLTLDYKCGGVRGGTREKSVREAEEEVAGSGRNWGKLHNIMQHFAFKKAQRGGSRQK